MSKRLFSTTALSAVRPASTLLSALADRQEGGVAAIMGLAIVPLVFVMGLAVDGGLAYGARSKLQGAIDAAVLAGAQAASTDNGDVLADTQMFFDANFPSDYLGGQVVNFETSIDDATREITINAEVEVPTAFMQLAGLPTIKVAATSTAQQELSGIELALVLDVTGSMNQPDPGGGTKLEALKTASQTLLDTLYGDDDTIDDVSVAVVPYNTEVNLGSDRTDFLTGYDPTAFGAAGWAGCVEARTAPFDQDDAPPSAQPFTALLWPATTGNPYNPGNDPNAYCPTSKILPLTAEKSVISAHIDGLQARGFTMTNVGFTWGWRAISPRWRGEWNSSAAPVDYDDPKIKKAIIFMTDGVADWSDDYYTAYGFLSEGRLGTQNEQIAEAEVNDRLLDTCEAAKAAGLEVYTVMFALNNPAIEADYRACASSDEHFFDAPDGAELEAAFRQIAGQLTSLRLTQ